MQHRRTWMVVAAIGFLVLGSAIGWLIHPSNIMHNQTASTAPVVLPSVANAPLRTVSPPPPGAAADLSHLPVVYETDFSNPAGEAWTSDQISKTPKTHSPFLGQFGNETVTFAVHALPRHDFLHLTCKLYIINTWDGIAHHNGGGRIGPDFWSLDLADGPNLIRSTFSNTNGDGGFASAAAFQDYPAPIPSTPVPWGTGAISKNALGYEFKFKGISHSFPMDTVYPIDITLPHSADNVAFNFTGAELQDISDEGWGLADVKLEALPAAALPKFDPTQFEPLLNDAAGNDAIKANQAFWQLVRGGDWTANFLIDNVRGLGINMILAKQAVRELSSPNPDQQLRAAAELSGTGPAVEPLLDSAAGDEERIQQIREAIVIHPLDTPDRRRGAVASRVLQIINTPQSKAALETLQSRMPPEDWAIAMAGAYSLAPGQVLKYVPPPLPKARDDYWPRERRFMNLMNGNDLDDVSAMPSQFVFSLVDDLVDLSTDLLPITWQQIKPGVYGPPPGLRSILATIGVNLDFHTNSPRIIVPPEMDDIALPGDWLIRHGAKSAVVLAALEPILKQQTGRSIHFQKQKIDEDVIEVTGSYAFKSLDIDPADRVLLFAGDTTSKDDMPQWSGITDMYGFLQTLSNSFHLQFTNPSAIKGTVNWQFRSSSQLGRPEITPAVMDAVLKNVTRQTGLQFKRTKQPMDALIAVEDKTPGHER